EHGVTWHLMSEQADQGDIVAAAPVQIAADETAFSLNLRCYEAGVAAFANVAAALASGALQSHPQPAGERRMYRRRRRPLVFVDPGQPASRTHRAARALDLGERAVNTVGALRLLLRDEVLVAASVQAAADAARPGAPPGTIV